MWRNSVPGRDEIVRDLKSFIQARDALRQFRFRHDQRGRNDEMIDPPHHRHAVPKGLPHEVETELVTVRERILAVMQALAQRDACDFDELLFEAGQPMSRAVLVATFLAVLELARLEAIGLYQGLDAQGAPQGPIHLRRRGDLADRSWLERIPELM